jgi:uracil-DNA glycosylase
VDYANSDKQRRYELLTPLECMGHQETLVEMKEEASTLRAKTKKESNDFLKLFFTYEPAKMNRTQKQKLRTRLRKTIKSESY